MDFELLDFWRGVGVGQQRFQRVDETHLVDGLDAEQHDDTITEQHRQPAIGIYLDGQRGGREAIGNLEGTQVQPVAQQQGTGFDMLAGVEREFHDLNSRQKGFPGLGAASPG